jgi:diaminohydroxyphosphoribosylaminopyrimidine deaminase/5-amino-6-(5-phosphoribosylamino)uracil reductase
MALSEQDLQWMRHAIRLAKRGFPAPNPHVGAVIVKDGALVGEGFHPYKGAPHAEVFALQQAGERARGATLYVTLEPCCHYGFTPPCTNAIRAAGIARVVVGMLDPNPEVNGKGVQQLREAGVQVEILSPDIPAEVKLINALEAVNRIYLYWRRHNRPFITLKAAMSLDGKIATHTGNSKWITGTRARGMAHRLRAEHQAVLVGVETVIRDRPRLTARVRAGGEPAAARRPRCASAPRPLVAEPARDAHPEPLEGLDTPPYGRLLQGVAVLPRRQAVAQAGALAGRVGHLHRACLHRS